MEEEEEEKIGFVLARASELKLKLSECFINSENKEDSNQEEDEENEEESTILKIRDAFESLEQQLSNLQVLQQQQRYERESSLLQIDRSRNILLNELTNYKKNTANTGLIQEALTFAGGPLNHDAALFLPPYPHQSPHPFVTLDQLHPSSRFASNHRSLDSSRANGSEEKPNHNPLTVKRVLLFIAKSALTIVGAVSVLSAAGFKPAIDKKLDMGSKIQEMYERVSGAECPPGKVAVVEDGGRRCVVKERVEVPFDVNLDGPDISYGFG